MRSSGPEHIGRSNYCNTSINIISIVYDYFQKAKFKETKQKGPVPQSDRITKLDDRNL